MPYSTRSTRLIPKTPLHRTQWHRIQTTRPLRHFSSTSTSPSASEPASKPEPPRWFTALRSTLLSRNFPPLIDDLSPLQSQKLEAALTSFLPPGWAKSPFETGNYSHILPPGYHLIYFNPALPADELLPDGTDPLQSPGEPFVRRMWAGGAVRWDEHGCWDPEVGLVVGMRGGLFVCAERIKEAVVRGEGDLAKIYVTVERRVGRVVEGDMAAASACAKMVEEGRKGEEWGGAVLVEERNLVFMKDRSREELRRIRDGPVVPPKYLPSLTNPSFSHALTPTPSLLFRYSALTFNAHAIHLDPEYCRNIEGHRNLLVHGPLSLTLMLSFISYHLKQKAGAQIVKSIEYKNLAPLYCGEQLRVCGKEKEGAEHGKGGECVYDVWIEGPTGGTAVKGTV
ncbi:uncharacterized protein BDR25DRAFT_216539, partial [Lindgomyces ingoldianus]